MVPLFIIFAGKKYLVFWYRNEELSRNWRIGLSNNGWTINELGVQWAAHFNQHTLSRTKGTKRLLILDGHESHHSMDFEEYCKDNGIVTLCMPPHSSHKLQPLDVVPFSVLKRAYSVYIEGLIRRHQTHIAKEDFLIGFFEVSK